jgi:hypothetical protein
MVLQKTSRCVFELKEDEKFLVVVFDGKQKEFVCLL